MTSAPSRSVPENIGEIADRLAWMFLEAPHFKSVVGPIEGYSIETVFSSLNEGLDLARKKLGEEKYGALIAMSKRARAHCEADPEDDNGQAREGRRLIREMREMLIRRPAK